ncbi:MAG: Farnesyl pyrophosphate synthetase [Trizodia sp. TS-e1964]|nr:MAG: Farnesyl pyrophosphate synthetase [Trizodia sp. TS-e1964]
MATPTTLQEFEKVFPKLVDDLLDHARHYKTPDVALQWLRENLIQNTVGGKCNRGMSVVDTSSLILGRALTSEEYFNSAAMGWMTELLQAFFLVSDDIMDSSKTRRGNPCWYLMPNVGMIAINDACMLETGIFLLLKKYFKSLPCYIDLVELFIEVKFQTQIGQLCDLLTAPEDKVDLSSFSMEKFTFIVLYKTAFYSFYLPVALSLHLNGLASEVNLKIARDILIPLGEYFQIQDDFLDNFGAPEVIGKIGTDIQDNKCSWLINQALPLATPAQRKILDENYGHKDGAKEAKVKEVYAEMKLDDIYRAYEEKRVGEIRKMIAAVDESTGLKKSIFETFLAKIYKRSK